MSRPVDEAAEPARGVGGDRPRERERVLRRGRRRLARARRALDRDPDAVDAVAQLRARVGPITTRRPWRLTTSRNGRPSVPRIACEMSSGFTRVACHRQDPVARAQAGDRRRRAALDARDHVRAARGRDHEQRREQDECKQQVDSRGRLRSQRAAATSPAASTHPARATTRAPAHTGLAERGP